MFYYTLGRLLFMEDSPAKFKAFIAPFQAVSCTPEPHFVQSSMGPLSMTLKEVNVTGFASETLLS